MLSEAVTVSLANCILESKNPRFAITWSVAPHVLPPQLLVYNQKILLTMRAILFVGLLLSLCASAQTAAPKSPSSEPSVPQFKDVAKEAGLTVSHISTPEKKYIVESMSGGAGLIDCDNDGKLDIITVNGSTIDR